jgi:hypothetical protein
VHGRLSGALSPCGTGPVDDEAGEEAAAGAADVEGGADRGQMAARRGEMKCDEMIDGDGGGGRTAAVLENPESSSHMTKKPIAYLRQA